ncbi:hypothetical protein [Streptomyces sp. DW26H14]|uniref:hypothetical protein n=1 Tax=Streptomyces sp. DW26H14 TaxID=3435395 RepID=UPI00403DA21C
MSTIPAPRSSAAVNAEIRALLARACGVMTREQAAEYQQLLGEWEAAVRREVAEAA